MKKHIIALLLILTLFTLAALAESDGDAIQRVQTALNEAGYACGTPDGIAGPRTRAAIEDFQKAHQLEVTGEIDDELLAALGLSDSPDEESHTETDAETDAETDTETDDDAVPTATVDFGGSVTGEFDEPALVNPRERYETWFDKTDGSDYAVFAMLDAMNDEAADIEKYGALYVTEHPMLDDQGRPTLTTELALQDGPYGKMICTQTQILWMKALTYTVGEDMFIYDGDTVERTDGDDQEQFDYYCESYHFPYGPLDALNGIRQDENGYNYFFIRSDENRSFEFVTGEGLRILQLRVYEKNGDGDLALTSYADYDVGPAWEIPQPVLDAMEVALG